jgi:hypothetical protein
MYITRDDTVSQNPSNQDGYGTIYNLNWSNAHHRSYNYSTDEQGIINQKEATTIHQTRLVIPSSDIKT